MKGLAELKCAQRFEYLSWLNHHTLPGTTPNCLLRFKIVSTSWAWELWNYIQITSQHCNKKGKTQGFLVIIAWNSLPQNERNKTLSLQPEHAWAENMEALWGHLQPPEWKLTEARAPTALADDPCVPGSRLGVDICKRSSDGIRRVRELKIPPT